MEVNEEDAAVIQILLDADDDAEKEESAPLQTTAKSPGPSIDIRDAVFINLDIATTSGSRVFPKQRQSFTRRISSMGNLWRRAR